jgi:hypothetical protein
MFLNKKFRRLTLMMIFIPVFAAAQIYSQVIPEFDSIIKSGMLFPHVYYSDIVNSMKKAEATRPYWVSTAEELQAAAIARQNHTSLLLNNDILAYYGHPNSQNMGILGRHSMEELDKMLTELAAEYEALSGGRKIIKAFYLIYGTVWPQGEIGIIRHETLMDYIEYGLKNNILIFIDHQIGRFDPVESLKRMLPYLHYPNVHLALDPEWRTTRPMLEIGHVTAEEINRAQKVMEDYIIENNIPGERFLVIHQFNFRMIRNREQVRSDFSRVRLVHCADGIGPPQMKRDSYAFNALADNMPVKSFKLFYNLGITGAGYDNPLMTPRQVYELNPRPYIIMYQ